MISFKMVWDDVESILNEDTNLGIDIVEKYNDGFVVRHEGDTTFINKDDFVSVWCKMQCNDEVCLSSCTCIEDIKEHYVCQILKMLPYVQEETIGVLKVAK